MKCLPGSRIERLTLLVVAVAAVFTGVLWWSDRHEPDPPTAIIHVAVPQSAIQKDDVAWRIFSEFIPQFAALKYEWGAWDCSAFVQVFYRDIFGFGTFPRTARDQCALGSAVKTPAVGDLACYDTTGNGVIDHVGIYAGSDHIAHNSASRGVCLEKVSTPWLVKGFVKWVHYEQ